MAAVNPLEDILSSEIDDNVLKDFVGTLESTLASPTHKETPSSLSVTSVNSNHVNSDNLHTACTAPSDSIKSVQLTNITQINNITNSSAKTLSRDNEIIGINSLVHSSAAANNAVPVAHIGNASAPISSSPKPTPVTPSIRIVTQQTTGNQPVNQSVVTCMTNNSAILTNSNRDHSDLIHSKPIITVEQKPVIQTIVKPEISNNGVKTEVTSIPQHLTIKSEQLNSHVKSEGQGIQNELIVGKSGQPTILNVTSSQPVQRTNVHIVHNPALKQGHVGNPSVIAVRPGHPTVHQTVLRPQPINSSSPRPAGVGKVVAHGKLPGNTPIRITSTQPSQINIAPRPGGTITLPPGMVPGAMLVKNEQGQIVIVQPGTALPTQVVSSSAVATSAAPKVQYVTRHPNSQQILTIHPQPQGVVHPQPPQTIVRQAIPSPVAAPRPQQTHATTVPSSTPPLQLQTVVRSPAPAKSAPVGMPPQHGVSIAPVNTPTPIAPNTALHQQQVNMQENVKKCKNFLSTLIKLASSQPADTVQNVRQLIQGLIDGKVEPEMFTEKLQKELKSSPQPYLVPFLKKSLPLLRQSLISKMMTIEGVRPPPLDVFKTHGLPVGILPGTPVSAYSATVPAGQGGLSHSRVQLQPKMNQQMVLGVPKMAGNLPNTVHTALHSSRLHTHSVKPDSTSPGVAQHKEKKKFESLKDDDDINDVATMGGVNLSEESKNILATNADYIGTQIRSCKDALFLHHSALLSRITHVAKKHGLDEISPDVANLISHATQERLRDVVEKLSTIAEHRGEIYKINDKFDLSNDVKSQLKFLEELDTLEKKRHEDQEKEMLRRAAKSRSKHEDPEQAKLKQKAKELQQAEMEEVRQREANLTALAAIGPRKKRKTDHGEVAGAFSTPGTSNGMGSTPARTSLRPRVKRVNLRDVMFLMEQEKSMCKSNTLYKTFLR